MKPTVTLHVATSLDGYLARKDNSVSWLESPSDAYPEGVELNAAEIEKVLASIDCYVMGSRTYEHALELGWPYGDTPVVVVTHRTWKSTRASVEFYAGDLSDLVRQVLAPRFDSVWIVGGADLCQQFLKRDLVDRLILSLAPVLLGEGLRLFDEELPEHRWSLKDVTAFRTGFVELTYEAQGDGTS